MTIMLRMNDQMNRRLSCDFTDGEEGSALAKELVEYGFICKVLIFFVPMPSFNTWANYDLCWNKNLWVYMTTR